MTIRRPFPDEPMATAYDFATAILERLEKVGVNRGEFFDVVPVVPAREGLLSDPAANGLGPWAKGSATSRRAAWDNFPRSGKQRHRILLEVWRRGEYGATRAELAGAMPDSSVDPRVLELIKGGWLWETSRTRPTSTGSKATVLIVTQKALERLEAEEAGQ